MSDEPVREIENARFRRTFLRVMSVQAVTLLLLWALQRHFGH